MKTLYETYPEYSSLFDELYEKVPLLHQLKDIPQNFRWHQEGCVETHTLMVIEEMIPIANAQPEERKLILILSALLHDVGKVLVTKEVDGTISSKGHELAGATYLKPIISTLPLSPEVRKQLLGIIGYHDKPRILVNSDAPLSEYQQLAQIVDLELLYLFELADVKGRICHDLTHQLAILETFKSKINSLP